MVSPTLLEQAKPIIEEIAASKAGSATFAYYTGDDISQEVWAICLYALSEYVSTSGPLENYLRVCVNNRLRNLRRDRYFRPAPHGTPGYEDARIRMNLVNALPLGEGDPSAFSVIFGAMPIEDPSGRVEFEDSMAFIRDSLSRQLLEDFDALLKGELVPDERVEALRRVVLDLIREEGRG